QPEGGGFGDCYFSNDHARAAARGRERSNGRKRRCELRTRKNDWCPPVRSAAKQGPALDPNELKQVWPKFEARFSDAMTLPSEFGVLAKTFVTVKRHNIIVGSMNVELPPRGPSTVYRKIGHRSDRDCE